MHQVTARAFSTQEHHRFTPTQTFTHAVQYSLESALSGNSLAQPLLLASAIALFVFSGALLFVADPFSNDNLTDALQRSWAFFTGQKVEAKV